MRVIWAGIITLTLVCTGLRAADHTVDPVVSRIKRETIESCALAAVGYGRKFHILEIEFRDGLIYRYEEVPPPVYHELLSAESKARYYNQNIRGQYHCLRVKAPRKR